MMKTKFSRREFLQLAAGTAVLPAIRHAAWAQTYPTRPVRWLLGFAPGGPNDVLARLLGQHLSEKLGQPFVIESRPGAGGNLATQAVANAAPDGHTLLGIGHFNAINTTLYKQLPFDFMRDIVPVAGIAQAPNVLMVHPSVPATTVAELIAYLKANPDKVSYPSSGNGTSSHLAAELFKAMTGTSMQHVPYRGTGAVWPDLLSPGRCRSISPRRSDRSTTFRKVNCARSQSRPRRAPTCCRACRLSRRPCRDSRSLPGSALARPRPRRPRSSAGSTTRTTPASPNQRSRRGLPTWAAERLRIRRPNSAGLLPKKPRSGER